VDPRSGPTATALSLDQPGMDPRIAPARLRWHDDQPFSETFGDIYHAPDGAAEVARVFLVPSAFGERAARQPRLRAGELGFGSALNFVVAAEACLAAGAALQFVSFEAAPIAPDDFTRLAARRSRSHPLYAELAAVYPPLVRGWHQRHLAGGRIRLTVYWGDATTGIADLAATQRRPLDAWFLDGFAPDRNPELWTDTLFEGLAGLSAPGTTVATFTAAGRVRRSLEAAGFAMRRVDQRPHKRESLAGTFAGAAHAGFSPPTEATVLGAGLAGASVARHLAEAGVRVRVFEPHPPPPVGTRESARPPAVRTASFAAPTAGSAVPTTVLHARLLARADPLGLLRSHAFLYAAAWAARFDGFTATGVLQLPAATDLDTTAVEPGRDRPDLGRLAAVAATWGATGPWVEPLDRDTARARAAWPVPSGGLWFAGGGVVHTPRLCAALLDHPAIELVARAAALPDTPPAPDQPCVLACGMAALQAAPASYLELAPVTGQLDYVALPELPRAPIVGNGYLAPAGALLAAGATYEYREWDPEIASRHNLAQLGTLPFEWRSRVRGVRTTSSDRTAIAGPPFDTQGRSLAPLYVSAGHGSMGNVSSHFAAGLIAAQITGDAPPMAPSLAAALSPLRFRERQRRRGVRHGGRS